MELTDDQKLQVNNIIKDVLSGATISADNHLQNDLDMDSLDLVEIVMMIESHFDISLNDDDAILNVATVGGFYGLIEYELTNE